MRSFSTSNLFADAVGAVGAVGVVGAVKVGKVAKKKKKKEETNHMPKTVTASEAKNRLGAVLSYVRDNQDEVIIESRGAPAVVIMAYAEYEKVLFLKEGERRKQALERLRKLRAEVLAQNQDLTPEEGDALADRFSHEIIEDMVREGKIRFEE